MTDATFDPGGFLSFDLNAGSIHSREGARMLLLSDAVLAPLVSAAVSNGDLTAVRKLGRELGDATARAVPDANSRPAEQVLSSAAAVLAVFGWGRLEIQRWGDALVAHVEGLPALDDDHLGVAALLGGLFSALASAEVACVPVSEDGRFLLVSPEVAQKVWKWSRGGDDVAAIVGRLAAPGAS